MLKSLSVALVIITWLIIEKVVYKIYMNTYICLIIPHFIFYITLFILYVTSIIYLYVCNNKDSRRKMRKKIINKYSTKDNVVKISGGILLIYIVVQIIPGDIYVEEVIDPRMYRETYVFTKSKPMTDQEAFDLVVEYDINKNLDNLEYGKIDDKERYYFPSQYTDRYGHTILLSKEGKKDLANYSYIPEEFDRPIPLRVVYDYEKKIIGYYWWPKDVLYESYYPLE